VKWKKIIIMDDSQIIQDYKRLKRSTEELVYNYKCTVCFEVSNFPILYQCNRHYSCHKCISNWFNSNKIYSPNGYIANIYCGVCTDKESKHTSSKTQLDLRELVSMAAGNIKTKVDLQKMLAGNDYKNTELQCPYCDIAIDVHTNYSHVYTCNKRVITCSFCKLELPAQHSIIENHMDYLCKGFTCSECKTSGLNRKELLLHKTHTDFVTRNKYNMSKAKACKNFMSGHSSKNIEKLLFQYQYLTELHSKISSFIKHPGLAQMDKLNKYMIVTSVQCLTTIQNIDTDVLHSMININCNNNSNSNSSSILDSIYEEDCSSME
jgi:hypothetical protein